jgi:hypothetical protein
MFEAAHTEFPFVEALPKREKSKVSKLWDHFAQVRELVAQKGMLVPQQFVGQLLGVSRQRVHQLVNEGRFEVVELQGHRYLTEKSVLAFAQEERKAGRPLTTPSNKELWRVARENACAIVSKKTS